MDAGRHVSNHVVLNSLGENVVFAIFSCVYCCSYLSDRKKISLLMHIAMRLGQAYPSAQSNQYFLQYQTVEFEAKDLFRLRVCS